jgi:peptidoglycan/xylan/chitin deacetylase (PgdA/CDA1 family)
MVFGILCNGESVARTPPKRIAITIDDAPSPSTTLFTGLQRASSIIEQLKNVEAPPIGVFAIGQHAISFGDEQLKAYGAAGHAICNHTFSHRGLKSSSVAGYIADIQKAEGVLKSLPGYTHMFRPPYLDEGYPDQFQSVRAELKKMGYTLANITVNNCDYYISHLLQSALNRRKKIDYEKLKKVYLETMLECVDYFEGLYKLRGKEGVNHVLLMHSNDLTALYIGDLITALRDKGWTIISVHDAYKPAPKDLSEKEFSKLEEPPLAENPAAKRNAPQSMSTRYLSDLFHQEKVIVDEIRQETYTAQN